jgi:hypothetical protein
VLLIFADYWKWLENLWIWKNSSVLGLACSTEVSNECPYIATMLTGREGYLYHSHFEHVTTQACVKYWMVYNHTLCSPFVYWYNVIVMSKIFLQQHNWTNDSETFVGWSYVLYSSKARIRTSLIDKLLLTTFYLMLVFFFLKCMA